MALLRCVLVGVSLVLFELVSVLVVSEKKVFKVVNCAAVSSSDGPGWPLAITNMLLSLQKRLSKQQHETTKQALKRFFLKLSIK